MSQEIKIRHTIDLTPSQHEILKKAARTRRTTMAVQVRRAVEILAWLDPIQKEILEGKTEVLVKEKAGREVRVILIG